MKRMIIGMALLVAGVACGEKGSWAYFKEHGEVWGSTNYTCLEHSDAFRSLDAQRHKKYLGGLCEDPNCPGFGQPLAMPILRRGIAAPTATSRIPTNVVWIIGATNAQFGLQWRLCTNLPAYRVGLNSDDLFWYDGTSLMTNICATNGVAIMGFPATWTYSRPCQKDHVDLSQHEDVYVVTSNLFSRIQWRGESKETCLEMIPVTNYVRHWSNVVEKRYKD